MSDSPRGRGLLDGMMGWLGRLPAAVSGHVTVDVSRRRLRLSHEKVEALTRRLLRDVRALEVGDWTNLPHAHDVRLKASGWKLRVEVALERVELPGCERPVLFRYYVLPESEEKARKQFAMVPELVRFFSEKFGPYPFPDDKFALAETPIWGMEHATVIAYGNSFPDAIRDTGAVDPYELRNKLYDYVLVHEAAHEWWGNAISAASWGDFWLHEGFSTYAEALWVEHVHGLWDGIRDRPLPLKRLGLR